MTSLKPYAEYLASTALGIGFMSGAGYLFAHALGINPKMTALACAIAAITRFIFNDIIEKALYPHAKENVLRAPSNWVGAFAGAAAMYSYHAVSTVWQAAVVVLVMEPFLGLSTYCARRVVQLSTQ